MASVWGKTSATKPRLNIFAIRDLDSLQAPGYDSVRRMESGVEPCQLVKVIKFGKASTAKRPNGVHVALFTRKRLISKWRVSAYKCSYLFANSYSYLIHIEVCFGWFLKRKGHTFDCAVLGIAKEYVTTKTNNKNLDHAVMKRFSITFSLLSTILERVQNISVSNVK